MTSPGPPSPRLAWVRTKRKNPISNEILTIFAEESFDRSVRWYLHEFPWLSAVDSDEVNKIRARGQLRGEWGCIVSGFCMRVWEFGSLALVLEMGVCLEN